MTILEEIKSKCSAELIASRDHDAIAATVSAGRVKVVEYFGGPGTVMNTLGAEAGAALLDQLEAMAQTTPSVKWAFVLINRDALDFGSAATRAMIDLLVPEPAKTALKRIAEVADPITEFDVRCNLYLPDGTFLG